MTSGEGTAPPAVTPGDGGTSLCGGQLAVVLQEGNFPVSLKQPSVDAAILSSLS